MSEGPLSVLGVDTAGKACGCVVVSCANVSASEIRPVDCTRISTPLRCSFSEGHCSRF
jgi:hypothetical protein